MITYCIYLDGMRLSELSDDKLRFKGEASDMVRSLIRKFKRDERGLCHQCGRKVIEICRPWRDRKRVMVSLHSMETETSHRRKKWVHMEPKSSAQQMMEARSEDA